MRHDVCGGHAVLHREVGRKLGWHGAAPERRERKRCKATGDDVRDDHEVRPDTAVQHPAHVAIPPADVERPAGAPITIRTWVVKEPTGDSARWQLPGHHALTDPVLRQFG